MRPPIGERWQSLYFQAVIVESLIEHRGFGHGPASRAGQPVEDRVALAHTEAQQLADTVPTGLPHLFRFAARPVLSLRSEPVTTSHSSRDPEAF